MKINWEGVYPALTTKFKADGSIDYDMIAVNMKAQIDGGIHGAIFGGSLGESSTLTHSDRIDLLNAAKEMVDGKIPLLVNIAEGSTKDAVALAQLAQDNDADGLMVLPPMMYKATDDEVTEYFMTIARNTDLPILIYNNPVDYKINVTLDMFEKMLTLDNIQAVKESTRDLSNITRIRNRFGDDLKILAGVDTLCLEALLMGADGLVAGLVCAFPAETVAIYKLAKEGRIAEALEIYRWFMPLLELDIDPQLVQNIKLAEKMVGIGTEHVRPPRMPLSGKRREEVINIIQTGLENRPDLSKLKLLEMS